MVLLPVELALPLIYKVILCSSRFTVCTDFYLPKNINTRSLGSSGLAFYSFWEDTFLILLIKCYCLIVITCKFFCCSGSQQTYNLVHKWVAASLLSSLWNLLELHPVTSSSFCLYYVYHGTGRTCTSRGKEYVRNKKKEGGGWKVKHSRNLHTSLPEAEL